MGDCNEWNCGIRYDLDGTNQDVTSLQGEVSSLQAQISELYQLVDGLTCDIRALVERLKEAKK